MAENDSTTDAEKAKADEILRGKLGNPGGVSENEPILPEEDIEKVVAHKEWTIKAPYVVRIAGVDEEKMFERTYVQKPLSYHAFGEFTGLIGRKLAEAMRGPDGLSLDRLSPGDVPLQYRDGKISLADTEDNEIDPIVQGIAKLATYVPDLMGEAQCIWLRIPRSERGMVLDFWSRPVDEGGMSMDEGEEMLELFIEQNYDELNGFLKRYGRVKNVVQRMRKRSTKEE